MTNTEKTIDSWRVARMKGGSGTISHSYIAQAPGCPSGPHPTRWCGCKVFRTEAQAEAYIVEQESGGSR